MCELMIICLMGQMSLRERVVESRASESAARCLRVPIGVCADGRTCSRKVVLLVIRTEVNAAVILTLRAYRKLCQFEEACYESTCKKQCDSPSIVAVGKDKKLQETSAITVSGTRVSLFDQCQRTERSKSHTELDSALSHQAPNSAPVRILVAVLMCALAYESGTAAANLAAVGGSYEGEHRADCLSAYLLATR